MTSPGGRFVAVVFDMDGLLVDSEPLWHEAEIEVFARHGVALTVEQCRETKGKFVVEVARYWYQRHPWPGASPDEVAVEIVKAMEELFHADLVLKAGAASAVEFFARRSMPMAVASSSPRLLIDVVMTRFFSGVHFNAVCSAEDEAAGKPDPAIFRTAARLLKVRPECCVVFEDSPAGVRAAKAAGMACVAVPEYRWDAADDDGLDDQGLYAGADVVLRSLEDVGDQWWRSFDNSAGYSGK